MNNTLINSANATAGDHQITDLPPTIRPRRSFFFVIFFPIFGVGCLLVLICLVICLRQRHLKHKLMKRRMAKGKAPALDRDVEAANEVQERSMRQEIWDHMERLLAVPKAAKPRPSSLGEAAAPLGH